MATSTETKVARPLAVSTDRSRAVPLASLFWKQIPAWKRAFDIGGSLIALIICAPVMALVALTIKCISRGPVLFKQERLGYGAKPFTCLKFRTMRRDCDVGFHREHAKHFISDDGRAEKLDGRDPRLLPFARIMRASGIDELPQLINVLRGDMSLIGPRPCLGYEAECFRQWQWRRFDVRPGITGLWQVSGKNLTSFNQMMRLDIRYAAEFSLAADLRIALKTIPVITGLVIDSMRPQKESKQESECESDGQHQQLRPRPIRSLAGILWGLLLLVTLAATGCRTYETAEACPSPGLPQGETDDPELVLVPGDEIEVKFFFNPELNDVLTIRPDGMITLQFINDVRAAGKTPSQLRNELRESYTEQLKEPEVVIIVRSLFQRRVYVGGEVKSPGMIEMPGRMDVLQAIMEAGGIDAWHGDTSNIVVIRNENGRRVGCQMDFKATLERGTGDVYMLQPMDIVYVSRTPIANLNQWVEQHINRLLPRLGLSFGPGGEFYFSR